MKPTTLRLLKASVNKRPFFPTNQLWDINTFLQDHNQWEEWSNRESWAVGLWFGMSMTVKKDKDNFIVISTARHLTRNTISYYTSQLMINPELMINLSTVTRHSPQNVIWSSILRLTAEEIKNSNAPNVTRHLQQNVVWFIISRDTVVEKEFQCKQCNKSYSRKYTFSIHIKKHNGEQLFQCKLCHKDFSQKYYLTEHYRRHSGVKEFQCDHCNKAFMVKSDLSNHMNRIHSKKKKFRCNICDRSFTQKYNLNTHVQLHNEEKQFKCDQCDKGFTQKCNLVTHQLNMHSRGKVFKCYQCNRAFQHKYHLIKHFATHRYKYLSTKILTHHKKNSFQYLLLLILDSFWVKLGCMDQHNCSRLHPLPLHPHPHDASIQNHSTLPPYSVTSPDYILTH